MRDGGGGAVLGIETSCDETSAAVVDETGIRGLAIASQDAHAAFGGVVPEIAAREHIKSLDAMVRHAMNEAGAKRSDIAGVGVTAGPGLVGALLVGVNWAKGYAFARNLPLIGIHHMEGHLFGTALEHDGARPPFIGLLVSGGHTLLLEVRDWGRYRLLGQTRDDAVGEAFDKVARRLGLGYPGGPEIERAATGGRAGRFTLPRPMLSARDDPDEPSYFEMSFSGLKTAVARLVAELEASGGVRGKKAGDGLSGSEASSGGLDSQEADRGLDRQAVADMAAEFQEAAVEVLVEKTLRAAKVTGCWRVVLGGGVARNSRLRERLAARLRSHSGELFAPSPRIATDNAAMIAAVARWRLARGERSPWSLNANPSLPFPNLIQDQAKES